MSNDSYESYDWDHLTTIALFYSNPDPQLLCYAHAKGVRLVYGMGFPTNQLGNSAFETQWIAEQLALVQSTNYDGINFDLEDPIYPNDSVTSALYTGLVAQTTLAFRTAFAGYQVTVDVAWSPNCIDGRCYDYFGLSQASDFLVVMDYDLRSQIFSDQCTASANSPPTQVIAGMLNFTALGIDPSKLVSGLPWYGYMYQCVGVTSLATLVCPIAEVPFRGVNCSDAAGTQYPYTQLMDILYNQSIPSTGELWDADLASPYFNFIDANGVVNQVWYDNAESLAIKVSIAKKLNLRGVSVWNIDMLSTQQAAQSQLIWDAMNSFFQ
eukprot:gene14977-17711_t